MKGTIMTIFIPSLQDVVVLAGSILGCALLVLSLREAYLWMRNLRNPKE
jgi:hypothetical protein